LTPDDEIVTPRDESSWYARQNVILEMGYFLGKWSRDGRVLVILKKGANLILPSDLGGYNRVGVPGSVGAEGQKIRSELEATFPNIDFAKSVT